MRSLALALLLPFCAAGQEVAFPFFAADAASAAGCTSSNLWLYIGTYGDSSSSGADGDFAVQKIKNQSDVPITIKRLAFGSQTNNAGGPPTWTAYVRDNPNFASGSTYGSASISTNRVDVGTDRLNMIWAAGTEPVVPANTDFYIGVKVAYNGAIPGTVSWRDQGDITDGAGYADTNYAAFLNGSPFGGNLRHDFDLEIWACYDRPTCTSSNIWSSPILQQQLTEDNYNNMAVLGMVGQHCHNTSSSKVMIKKVRLWYNSQGVGDVTMNALINTSGQVFRGIQYGSMSQAVNIVSGTTGFREFVWADGYEPIIPANTDFYIGAYPYASNLVMARYRNANVYETTSYGYNYNGSESSGADMAFEIYICQ